MKEAALEDRQDQCEHQELARGHLSSRTQWEVSSVHPVDSLEDQPKELFAIPSLR